MKAYVVYGHTYHIKDLLRKMKFQYIPAECIWAKIAESRLDDTFFDWAREKIEEVDYAEVFIEEVEDGTIFLNTPADTVNVTTKNLSGWKRSTFSYNKGQVIEIKAGLARVLKKEVDMDYFFRYLEVEEVVDEDRYNITLKVRFADQIASECTQCCKPLTDDISKLVGMGPICRGRLVGKSRIKRVEAEELNKMIIESIREIGVLGPFTFDKRKIKRVVDPSELKEYKPLNNNISEEEARLRTAVAVKAGKDYENRDSDSLRLTKAQTKEEVLENSDLLFSSDKDVRDLTKLKLTKEA